MVQDKFEKVPKMVKSKREPTTPRRRASLSKSGAIGKVTKVLSRPVSSTAPCVAPAANIKVVVRVRPPNDREQDENCRNVIKVVDDQILIFDPKQEEQPFFYHGVQQRSRDLLKKANKDITFVFDRVFNNASSNSEVFMSSTKSLINTLMDGYNCSVFAYGATGAGKTFTMIGNPESPGITYLTMKDLFKRKDELSSEREFEIMLTYIEVYNELVKDLLNPGPPLNLREDAKYGVLIPGVKGHKINNPEELFSLLEQGNRRRTQHPTDANAESSRSHAVFQVYIQMTVKTTREVRRAKLSMIDLAGSERGSATGFIGARFKEGANINKSLLALGNCINSLADGQKHVPYRDSKLTRLLKDSLGGNCHTIMIANVSPSSLSFDDTYNTLKYATRAKKIKSNIKRNIVSVDMHIDQYIKLVEDLQTENSNLKSENFKFKKEIGELVSKITEKQSSQEEKTSIDGFTSRNDEEHVRLKSENDELKQEIQNLKSKIDSLEQQLTVAASNAKTALEVTFCNSSPQMEPEKETVSPEVLTAFKKLLAEKEELFQREFQLQSSELGMSLRRQLKTETKQRLSSFYVHTPDKVEAHRKLHDQVLRSEKKEKVTSIKIGEIKESKISVDTKIHELLRDNPELNEEYEKSKLELEVLDSRYKTELKNKEIEILVDDHKDKCYIIENMAKLLKPLFLAVGGKDDAPDSIKREYEDLVAAFQGRKNLKWLDSGVSLIYDSGVSSSTSLLDHPEETNRATKRKIETDSQVSLDSTFLLPSNVVPNTTSSKSTFNGKAHVNPQIVAKGLKAPAPKRLASGFSPRNKQSPRCRISPRSRKSPLNKENKPLFRKPPVRPDIAKALINVKKNAAKSAMDRPRFKS